MLRSPDLFDDKPMSFGDHLEELRSRLIKALIGASLGIVLALFIGQHVVAFVRKPIDAALIRRGVQNFKITEDIGQKSIYDFIREWATSKKKQPSTAGSDNEASPSATTAGVPVSHADKSATTAAYASTSNIPADATDKTTELNEQQVKLKGDKLEVQVSSKQLLQELNQQLPKMFPEPKPDEEEKVITITVSAPEFSLFREAALRGLKPVSLNVQEPFLVFLKVSMVTGLLISSPWIFYQIWMFVAVGLYQHERKYIYVFGGVSMFLFFVGAGFCYYMVFPVVLDFLLTYNDWLKVEPQIRLSEWINFALLLPVMFGISFQLPLVMVFLEKLQIVEAKDYTDHRRMAILIISIISMVLTPSDPYSMLLMMFPLLFLYELGIIFCKFTANADPFAKPAAS